ncbi:MAG: hypothetical protein QXG39_02955 [Candidatus Aenigmatarchaeota archaeon]
MSGPGEGKLELKNAKVYLSTGDEEVLVKGCVVYVHVKGYSLARVTHLDIEHEILGELLHAKGEFLNLKGIKGGIEIKLSSSNLINGLVVNSIKIFHPFLEDVLPENSRTRTWVGSKEGGIYIGFRKEHIVKLEKIAREKFKFRV